MKKSLVTMLCCALLAGSLTSCGKTPADAPASQETQNEACSESSVESTVSEEVTYIVELTSSNDKIAVIKAYRELTGLGLKEAKDTVDLAPCVILETTNQEEANQYKTSLEAAGATVTITEGTAGAAQESAEVTTETESVVSSEASNTTGATFAVDSVFYITDAGTVFTGTVEQGCIKMGDSVVIFLEDGTEIPATINRIEVFGAFLEEAEAGKNVGLGFEEDITKESVLTAVSVVVAAEQ